MLRSFLESWNSCGVEIVKNQNLMRLGRPREANRTTNGAQMGAQKKFWTVGGPKIEIWGPRGGKVNPKGPTVEPKARLETPQGCQKGAQKRAQQEAFPYIFCHMFWPRSCTGFLYAFDIFLDHFYVIFGGHFSDVFG